MITSATPIQNALSAVVESVMAATGVERIGVKWDASPSSVTACCRIPRFQQA